MEADLKGKKLLVFGSSIKDVEIVSEAKKMGIYTVVTDYNTNWNNSPAKYIADEAWNINWTEKDEVKKMCVEHKIDGCITGFSEKRVFYAQKLCLEMGFPFYAENVNLDEITDKLKFKNNCIKSEITVPRSYNCNDKVIYPVIIKPSDGAGSQGITICYSQQELEFAYEKAKLSSDSAQVLIEEYIEADEVMIYYVVHNGNCTLSAMCDRTMQRFYKNITQLPIGYYYPSKYLSSFIKHGDKKFKKLINNLGIKNGLIAFQAFAIGDDFIPFDPTYRLDGTRAYHLTEHMNNSNALNMLIRYSLTGSMGNEREIEKKENPNFHKIGFMLPILLTKGKITKIIGMNKVAAMDNVFFISTRKKVGDVCYKEADFSQIFTRIHMFFNSDIEFVEVIEKIYKTIDVLDEDGKSMIIGRYIPERRKKQK